MKNKNKNKTTRTTASAILLFFCVWFFSSFIFFWEFLSAKFSIFLCTRNVRNAWLTFYFFFLIFIFFFFCGVIGLKPTSVTQAGASAVLQDLSDVLQAEHCRVTQELLAWPNIFIKWKHYICNRLDIHWLMGLEVNPVFHAQLDITAISELHDDNSNAI